MGPAYKGSDLREGWRRALERCGAPATTIKIGRPLCDACAARATRAANDPRTLIGMLRGAKEKPDDGKH